MERRKEVIGARPIKEPINVRGSLDANLNRRVSGSIIPLTSSIDTRRNLLASGSYLTYTGSMSAAPL